MDWPPEIVSSAPMIGRMSASRQADANSTAPYSALMSVSASAGRLSVLAKLTSSPMEGTRQEGSSGSGGGGG